MKTVSAVQFTSATAFPPVYFFLFRLCLQDSWLAKFRDADAAAALFFRREIHDRGEDGADNHARHLIPIKERYADPGRFGLVEEGRPDHREELDREEQVPPAPGRALAAFLIAVLQAHIVTPTFRPNARPTSCCAPVAAP